VRRGNELTEAAAPRKTMGARTYYGRVLTTS